MCVLFLLFCFMSAVSAEENAVIVKDGDGRIQSLEDKRALSEILWPLDSDLVIVSFSKNGFSFHGEVVDEADFKERMWQYSALSEAAEMVPTIVIVAATETPMQNFDLAIKTIQEQCKSAKIAFGSDVAAHFRLKAYSKAFTHSMEGRAFTTWKNATTLKGLHNVVAGSQSVVLYSLKSKPVKNYDGDTFQGYPILGKMKIEKKEALKGLESEIVRCSRPDDGFHAMCFHPRHAVSLKKADGSTITFLICFECRNERTEGLPTELQKALGYFSSDLRTYLNVILDAEGIPREQAK